MTEQPDQRLIESLQRHIQRLESELTRKTEIISGLADELAQQRRRWWRRKNSDKPTDGV